MDPDVLPRPTLAQDMRALEANPRLPADAQGPVFREPWQAQAFAMTLALHAKGVFAWGEWATMLGETIKAAQAAGLQIKINTVALKGVNEDEITSRV